MCFLFLSFLFFSLNWTGIGCRVLRICLLLSGFIRVEKEGNSLNQDTMTKVLLTGKLSLKTFMYEIDELALLMGGMK